MALLEGDEIPYSHYEAEKKNIVVPDELELDEFFVLMMAAKSARSSRNSRLAFRLIAQVLDVDTISRYRQTFYQVDFVIYGSDMERKVELSDQFDRRGYWRPHRSLRDMAGANKRVESGYFSDSDIIAEEPDFLPVILADAP
jgi:hypothetical protein